MKKCLMLLCACMITFACTTPEAALTVKMQGSSSQTVTFESCRAVAEDEIEFVFSRPVTVKNVSLLRAGKNRLSSQRSEDSGIAVDSVENGSTVKVKLKESAEPGSLITADMLAEDEKHNTINVLTSLRARNNRMPELVINEICTEYSNAAAGRKAEFIELRMKSDGNLGAMRLIINGNTNAAKQTIYEFPPVEVKTDDLVVLHLRTYDPASKDELGEDCAESGGMNSSPSARDFWIPGTSKLVHKEATIIYVLDQENSVLAAVIISNSTDAWWGKDYLAEAATFLYKQGFWISAGNASGPVDAARSAGTTNTRTICRDETVRNTNTAADWYVTATSSATPGGLNNPKRYE